MIRGMLISIGALLTIAGTVFALQGFGVLGGSVMAGSHFWAADGDRSGRDARARIAPPAC